MAVKAGQLLPQFLIVSYHNDDVDENAVSNLAGGACYLRGIHISNSVSGASANWLKFYNKSSPTVGNDEPDLIIPMAAVDDVYWDIIVKNKAGVLLPGYKFDILSMACTKTAGVAGTTAPDQVVTIALNFEPIAA